MHLGRESHFEKPERLRVQCMQFEVERTAAELYRFPGKALRNIKIAFHCGKGIRSACDWFVLHFFSGFSFLVFLSRVSAPRAYNFRYRCGFLKRRGIAIFNFFFLIRYPNSEKKNEKAFFQNCLPGLRLSIENY